MELKVVFGGGWSEFGQATWESIQWNWKFTTFIPSFQNVFSLNPFNGIESSGTLLSFIIASLTLESIQWNWKSMAKDSTLIRSFITARIHSMELKVYIYKPTKEVLEDLTLNPFNGIERPGSQPYRCLISRARIHSMELKVDLLHHHFFKI